MSFHALLVVVKMRAGLLQMIIRRDHMMELGILIVGWKLPFSCVKSVSEHIICHYLGSNTQPKTKSPKAVSWGGGVNSNGQPDLKITVFTPSLRFLPTNWFLQWLPLVQDDRKFASLNTSKNLKTTFSLLNNYTRRPSCFSFSLFLFFLFCMRSFGLVMKRTGEETSTVNSPHTWPGLPYTVACVISLMRR